MICEMGWETICRWNTHLLLSHRRILRLSSGAAILAHVVDFRERYSERNHYACYVLLRNLTPRVEPFEFIHLRNRPGRNFISKSILLALPVSGRYGV